ncbi:MAG: response regulator [Nitrospiraceae bacterium]|nr:response regulator [Nitrospiraceae bacterium]
MASILIIDDSSFMRGKIRNILKTDNHDIVEAADGMKGLQIASTKAPDLLLLDIIMPGMDGLKILSAIAHLGTRIPVVVITADIQESVYRQCMDLGAFAVVHKPPKEDELLSVVRKALEGKAGEGA